MPDKQTYTSVLLSPIGTLAISADEKGITRVDFTEERTSHQESPLTIACKQELREYFEGERTCFTVPLNAKGTPFQKEIWAILHEVPYGAILTYTEVAKKYGNIKTIRAVGAANGANPLAIITPCHRITGKDGKLVGYAGGLWRKKWLLNHEGATLF